MKIVYVGPQAVDDPNVHRMMKRRVEVAQLMIGSKGTDSFTSGGKVYELDSGPMPYNKHDRKGASRYREFLQSLERRVGSKITDVREVVPHFYGLDEKGALGNTFPGNCLFFDTYLTELRIALWKAYFDVEPTPDFEPSKFTTNRYHKIIAELQAGVKENTFVHVDMGNSLAVLYAAYYTVMDGLPIGLTFHAPATDDAPFGLGGFSEYARAHPAIRKKLMQTALEASIYLFIPRENIGAALHNLYPRMGFGFMMEPFLDFDFQTRGKKSSSS